MSVTLRLVAVALCVAPAWSALAFDEPPMVDPPEIDSPIDDASGWYIRGDIGYMFKRDGGDPSFRTYDSTTDSYATNSFDHSRMDGDFSIAGGAGYQFNDFLRSDLTLDYFRVTHKASNDWETCTPVNGQAVGQCRYDSQNAYVLSTLANAYVDLGTYWGITPYVGAGAGVSYVKWGNVKQKQSCLYLDSSDCAGLNFNGSKESGSDGWRFTYALMAGASYDISDRLKLDLGYRLSQIGKGNMFEFSDNKQLSGAYGSKGKDDGFARQEFRMGLRMVGW